MAAPVSLTVTLDDPDGSTDVDTRKVYAVPAAADGVVLTTDSGAKSLTRDKVNASHNNGVYTLNVVPSNLISPPTPWRVVVEGLFERVVFVTAAAEIGTLPDYDPGDHPAPVPVPGDRGLPGGGTTGQVLSKDSATDYDVSWKTLEGDETIAVLSELQTGTEALTDSDLLIRYNASASRWEQWAAERVAAFTADDEAKLDRLEDIRSIGSGLTLGADGTLTADRQSGGAALTIRDAHTRLGVWTYSSTSGTAVVDGQFKTSASEVQIALLEKNLTAHGGGADIPITNFTAGDQIEIRLASSDAVRRVYTVVRKDTPSGRDAIQVGYDVTLTSNQGSLISGVDYTIIHVRANVTTTGIEGADPISVGPTGLISLDQGGVQPLHLDGGEAAGFRSRIGAAAAPSDPSRVGAFTAADEAKLDRLRQELTGEVAVNYISATTENIRAAWHTKIVDVDNGNNNIVLRAFHNGSITLPDPFYCVIRIGSGGTGTVNVQGSILAGQGSYCEVFRLGDDWEVLAVPALEGPVTATRLTGTIDDARIPAGIARDSELPGAATTSTRGIIEIATNDEVDTGTDTQRAVTPSRLKRVLDRLTVPWARVSGKPTHIGTLTPPNPEQRDIDYNLRVRSILSGGSHFWVEDTGGSAPVLGATRIFTEESSNLTNVETAKNLDIRTGSTRYRWDDFTWLTFFASGSRNGNRCRVPSTILRAGMFSAVNDEVAIFLNGATCIVRTGASSFTAFNTDGTAWAGGTRMGDIWGIA